VGAFKIVHFTSEVIGFRSICFRIKILCVGILYAHTRMHPKVVV